MLINGKEVTLEDLVQEDLYTNFGVKRENGLVLSDFQVSVLERNQIPYQNCRNMGELLFIIEDCLDEMIEIDPELEELSRQVDEYRYYHDINH